MADQAGHAVFRLPGSGQTQGEHRTSTTIRLSQAPAIHRCIEIDARFFGGMDGRSAQGLEHGEIVMGKSRERGCVVWLSGCIDHVILTVQV
jgi:hypothetical protein